MSTKNCLTTCRISVRWENGGIEIIIIPIMARLSIKQKNFIFLRLCKHICVLLKEHENNMRMENCVCRDNKWGKVFF